MKDTIAIGYGRSLLDKQYLAATSLALQKTYRKLFKLYFQAKSNLTRTTHRPYNWSMITIVAIAKPVVSTLDLQVDLWP